MKQKLLLFSLAATAMFSVACGRAEDSNEKKVEGYDASMDEWSSEFHDDFNFIAFGGGIYGLVGVSKKEAIKICLSGVSASDFNKWNTWITDSTLKWLKPLRALTSDPIASTVDVVQNSTSGCDAYFRVVGGAWGYTTIGNQPSITVGPSVPFGVVIHEFGHAFGLSDTYQNGTSGNCQAGQPQSLMCNISYSDLQQDDINGMKRVFSSKYPNDTPGPVPTPTPTPTPTPKPDDGDETVPDEPTAEVDIKLAVKRSAGRLNYSMYFSAVSDDSIEQGVMTYCVGSASYCADSANFAKADFVGNRSQGKTQIYRAKSAVKLDKAKMVYVKFKSLHAIGDASFKMQKR